MSDGIKEAAAGSLIAAAAMSVGPGVAASEWDKQVLEKALGLARMIPLVVARFEVLEGTKAVPGILASVEEVKGRGVITSHATIGKPQRNQPIVNGRPVENFRTQFLNTPEGQAMFEQAQSLVGRLCRFGKRVEEYKDGGGQAGKVNMLEWIEDLGPAPAGPGHLDPGYVPPTAAPTTNAAPSQRNETPRSSPPAAPGPFDYVANGWRDQAEHDQQRKEINDFIRDAPDDVKAKFKVWREGRVEWNAPWRAEEAALAKSRLMTFADEAEQKEMAMAAAPAGEPVYEYGGEPC